MCPQCRMVHLMLMRRDWVVGNDIADHKWMPLGQQSANDQWVFKVADCFCVPNSHFLPHATCRGWCYPLWRVSLCGHVIWCKLERQTAKWVQWWCYGAVVAGNTARLHTYSAEVFVCAADICADKDFWHTWVWTLILVSLDAICQETQDTSTNGYMCLQR